MRLAQPTSAIVSPVVTFVLIVWLLTAAFASLAQGSTARTYAADCCGGTTAVAAPSGLPTAATMAATPNLSRFYSLLQMASERAKLRRPTEQITVFAPTNEALAAIPAKVSANLFQIGAPGLRPFVRTHLVKGAITPDQLTDGRELETLDGRKLLVKRQPDGTVLIDGVYRLRDAGQLTTNGVVYALDSAIAPQ